MTYVPRFTVSIPVKPYVKRFLEINYGLPVDFSSSPECLKFFQNLLRRPNYARDKQYPDTFYAYTETVEVVISQDDFYRYGWELSKTNVVAFGKRYETRAKVKMRSLVGFYIAMGLPINKGIEKFQDRFRFEEEIWHYEAIKKDFYRNGQVEVVDFNNEIYKKIEKIVLCNLYDLGTISKRLIKAYETS